MSQQPIPQATSSLEMWLDYLSNIHTSAIDLGLDRVQAVASKAKLTKPAQHVITVAGTNGKGSTCALMEAILLDAGYSVGVYSSPHLIRYNERVRINGQDLSNEKMVQSFDFIEKERGEISLSFFEYGTLAALRAFQTETVDVVLLEVGLGGRLDATNIVEHDVSVITSLAVDHVDWLGDDINVIGFEKAGIYRSGKPAICGQPKPPATVAAHADDIKAEFYQVGIQYAYDVDGDVGIGAVVHFNWNHCLFQAYHYLMQQQH
ncbi:Mur ligase family protein [Shewanella sp. 10N.286.48.B5]|uniref:Mur ligase family protein n=1 Tax=Shewanella sp. 10N.286.48.B5 TaxID=1880834 RepID=UPI0039A720F9